MTTLTDNAPVRLFGRFQIRHLYPLVALAIFPLAAAGPIGDNSFMWHVRAGEAQWDLGQVLAVDGFSYTMNGAAWRTQSWLAELFYSGLEAATGTIAWAPIMVTIVGITALALVGIAVYGSTRSTFPTAIWLFLAVWLAAPFATPRPVIWSYLLLAALVVIIRLEDRLLWAVVPLMWLFAALHGSWLIGLGLLILEAIRRRSWRIAGLAALSAVAVTFTAHGLGIWQIVLSFAANSEALSFLQEWGPPEFGDVVQFPYVLVVAGVLIASTRGRIKLNDLWIVLPFLLFGLTTQRTVFPAAIVLLPYAALAIDFKVPSGRQRPVLVWGMAALVVLIGAGILLRPVESPFEVENYPTSQVLGAVETERIFHDDAVGGYLIYRDWPERQVFIDDRAELYGAEFFGEFDAIRRGAYEDVFERYGITEAIVKPHWPLYGILLRDGWVVGYEDEYFAVIRSPAG